MGSNEQNPWELETKKEENGVSIPRFQKNKLEGGSSKKRQIDEKVEWRASEYIHHEKNAMWYVVLGILTVIGTGLALLFKQWLFSVLIVVMGVSLGIFAKRPPREIHYVISRDGITIGERLFAFNQFKSFGVLNEGAFYTIQLRPAKRFMPSVAIYFAEPDGERIFDVLAAHLPTEEINQTPVDDVMRWLRF